MTDDHSFGSLLPTKLHGAGNYTVWASQMQNFLVCKGLRELVQPNAPSIDKPESFSSWNPYSTKEPKPNDLRLYEAWAKDVAEAKLLLQHNIDANSNKLVASYYTARDVWVKLESMYGGSGFNLQYQYANEICNIRYENFNNVAQFISKFKALIADLASLGLSPPYI
ncbi:uncharacterized protein BP5553_07288 [Venustampulla echinocandica]|uniref:DUF4219 domain-containing protein n=1 Tax=Venustampulla echinocandica TaxID=2656787 RepID=A0A370TJ22_9HELO|nr:uncharacterized protein BP5553_07288 [Venustampulla echinocandica]RDL35357.1 hypothetical protein BP5553_07288 [Venustampulla echinocandica]